MMRGRDGEVTAAQFGSRPQPRDLFRSVSVFSDVFRLCQALRFRSCPALFDDIADLAAGRLVEAVFLFIKHTGDSCRGGQYRFSGAGTCGHGAWHLVHFSKEAETFQYAFLNQKTQDVMKAESRP